MDSKVKKDYSAATFAISHILIILTWKGTCFLTAKKILTNVSFANTLVLPMHILKSTLWPYTTETNLFNATNATMPAPRSATWNDTGVFTQKRNPTNATNVIILASKLRLWEYTCLFTPEKRTSVANSVLSSATSQLHIGGTSFCILKANDSNA